VPFPEWLQEIAAHLQSPEVKVVLGGRLYAAESQALSMLETHESERAAFTFTGKSSDIYYGYTNNMAVRRDVFDRCSPFLEIERGADSIFVHQVIERYSCEAIQHAPEALIRHLEITSVQKWFRKRFLYGRNFQKNYYRRKGSYRLLSNAESIAILKRTIQRKRCSAPGALFLVMLLWMGTFCYMSGRLSVRFTQSSSTR
jgi:hypothetical protein